MLSVNFMRIELVIGNSATLRDWEMPGSDFGLSKLLFYVPSHQLSLRLLSAAHITFLALASCPSISLECERNI